MKKLILIISLFLTYLNSNAQGVWVSQASGFATVSSGIRNISVVDTNVVWICPYDGSGGGFPRQDFSRTIDGGAHWQAGVTPAPAVWDYSMIEGSSATSAWAVFYNVALSPAGKGQVWHTTNGGTSWTQQGANVIYTNTQSFPNVIHFFDDNNGVIIGDPINGEFEIYTTTNGGTNWVAVPGANIPNPENDEAGWIDHISTFGDNVWFDTNHGRVFHSTDKGFHWTASQTNLGIPIPGFIDVCFYSATKGIARHYDDASLSSDIVETSNGGTTWSSIFHPLGSFFGADVQRVPGTNSMLVSTGVSNASGFTGSSYSTNGGHTWTTIDGGTQRNALGIADSLTMWAGGFTTSPTSGGIFKFVIFDQVPCSDPSVSPGNSSADKNIVCGGQTVTVSSSGVVSPVVGSYSGISWIISKANISGSLNPLNEPSLVATYRVTFPAPAIDTRTFINDLSLIEGLNNPFGTYYWTPVVFGNATAVSLPVQFLTDLNLDINCVHTGTSVPVLVTNPNQPCPTDGQAPTSPTNLVASGTTATTTNLNWTASTDNVGVTGYDVYKNNVFLITVPSNSYTVPGLTQVSTYTFFVRARDASGNISGSSNIAGVTTLCGSFNAVSVSISAIPSGNICPGTNVIFTATPTNPGTTPVYQWKKNGTNVGINSNTYSDNTLSTAIAITCILTSNVLCPTGNPATSNTITKNVSFVDDNNPCTIEGCNTTSGATTHTLIIFDDNNPCTSDGCNTTTGAPIHTLINTSDGNACTVDGCNSNTGVFHNSVNADDNNACTTDACNTQTGNITHTKVEVNDNNICTTDECKKSTGEITHTPIQVDDGNPCTLDGCDTLNGVYHNSLGCTITLYSNIFIEGYYIGNGLMNNCLFINGISTNPEDADLVTLSAMNPNSPYTLIDSKTDTLKKNGNIRVHFGPSVISNNFYYLKVTHRNAIETWSASPVLLTSSTTYLFSDAASKAFSDNEIATHLPGNEPDEFGYAIYSGDIGNGDPPGSGIQDGSIDSSDFIDLLPSIQNGDGGYHIGDLNGDGTVDAADFLVLDPNIQHGIGSSTP